MTSNHPATANATIAVLSHVDSQGRGVVRTGRCLMRIFTQRFQRVHLYVSGGFTAVFTALALSIGPGGALVKSLPKRSPGSLFVADVYRRLHRPMFLLRDRTALAVPIDAYLNLWEAK